MSEFQAYRCDSVETAALINANLQFLIQRAENQQRFFELEGRLIAQGFLAPPLPARRHHSLDNSDGNSPSSEDLDYTGIDDFDLMTSDSDLGSGRGGKPHLDHLQKALFQELKERLDNKEKFPILYPPKDYHMTIRISKARPGNSQNFSIIDDRTTNTHSEKIEEKIPAWRQYLFTKPDESNGTFNRRRRTDGSITSGICSDFSSTTGCQRPQHFGFFTPSRDIEEISHSPVFGRRIPISQPPSTAPYPLMKSYSSVPPANHRESHSQFKWESPNPSGLPKVSSSRLPRKNPPPTQDVREAMKSRRISSFTTNPKPNETCVR